jgi:hypothetical protein
MDAQPRPSAAQPEPTPSPTSTEPQEQGRAGPQRMFLYEPGWAVGLKVGSERVFCYQMAPGQDFYHRLLDGEIYLFHGDERLCLACAERRGLLSFEPKGLRQPLLTLDLELATGDPGGGFDLKPHDADRANGPS